MTGRTRILQLNGVGMESNSYLVLGDRPVLMDVGTGARHGPVSAELRGRLRGEKLRAIILTHMHFDHTGGAPGLQEETGAPALAFPPDSSALAEGDSELTCSGWLGQEQGRLEVRALRAGEVLEAGGLELEVLPTPGHTAGSICLFDRGKGILFSGDTVFANGGVGRWDLPTGNGEALRRSLEALSGLDVRGIYPGHGPYYEVGGNDHVKAGLAMLAEFLGS